MFIEQEVCVLTAGDSGHICSFFGVVTEVTGNGSLCQTNSGENRHVTSSIFTWVKQIRASSPLDASCNAVWQRQSSWIIPRYHRLPE